MTQVTLDGTGSYDPDPDQTQTLRFLWTAPIGITLDDVNSKTPSFTVPSISTTTTYTFSLVVTDIFGLDSQPSYVNITAIPSTSGSDITVTLTPNLLISNHGIIIVNIDVSILSPTGVLSILSNNIDIQGDSNMVLINNALNTSPGNVTVTLPGNGQFLAIGAGGGNYYTLNSYDGVTWTQYNLGSSYGGFGSIIYRQSQFVALPNNNAFSVYSSDGFTWNHSVLDQAGFWESLVYTGVNFVALANGLQYVVTSPDGITWTTHSTGSDNHPNGAAANDDFIIVSVAGNAATGFDYMTSSDNGITWTQRTFPVEVWSSDICNGNGIFFVYGTSNCVTSTNGTTWTTVSTSLTNPDPGYRVICRYCNGTIYLLSRSHINSSDDGITWSGWSLIPSALGGAGEAWTDLIYANGLYVAVQRANNVIITSTDTITWNSITVPAVDSFNGGYNRISNSF